MDYLNKKADFLEKTRSAFLWTRLLNIPFWAIFNMLVIILYKDLHATPLQITAFVAIKPIASLFSPYWSLSIYQRPDRLVSNLVWANIFKFFPFLCFPWLTNNWLFVLAFGCYMLFARAVIPAWMEVIKLNIKGTAKERIFALGSAMDYLGSAILPLAFGWLLDDYEGSWRWIFFGAAVVGIISTLFLFRIPVELIEMPNITNPPRLIVKNPSCYALEAVVAAFEATAGLCQVSGRIYVGWCRIDVYANLIAGFFCGCFTVILH